MSSPRSSFSSSAPFRENRARAGGWGGQGARIGAGAILVLVVLRIAAPIAVRAVLNRRLSRLPDYTGHIQDLGVGVLRGALQVRGLEFSERNRPAADPLVRARRVEIVVSYLPFFLGRVQGRVRIDDAAISLVQSPPVPASAPAKPTAWQDLARSLAPIQVTEIEVNHSSLRLRSIRRDLTAPLELNHLHLRITGLSNRPDPSPTALPATAVVEATTSGNGALRMSIQAAPLAPTPQFRAKAELQHLSLPPLNPWLLAYADTDVAQGVFDFFAEVNASGGRYQGYVKPLFRNLNFKTSNEHKPLAQRLVKTGEEVVAAVLKNPPRQQVGTVAPITGAFTGPHVDIWTTISNLLRNAFVRALDSGFGGVAAK